MLLMLIASCGGNVASNSGESLINSSSEEKESFIDVYTSEEKDSSCIVSSEYSGTETSVEPVFEKLVVTPPTKTTFELGEIPSYDGLKVYEKYTDNSLIEVDIDDVNISIISTFTLGKHEVTVEYKDNTASFEVEVVRTYAEEADFLEDIDASNLEELYDAFKTPITNYTSSTYSYFSGAGARAYFRHYSNNYVQFKVNLYLDNAFYSYPYQDEYLEIYNNGYLNKDNNYYSFSLDGDDVIDRLFSELVEEKLALVKEGASYQDDMFTLSDLNEKYFTDNVFTRISENKYQCTSKDVCLDFIDICAPNLINTGFYMTFSKVTIELNPNDEADFRIRLYASSTQSGKLVDENKDTTKENWYLLFSEAYISDIGTTIFLPVV